MKLSGKFKNKKNQEEPKMSSADIGGVWRTIGGRRVFIKDGEDLATAMKNSGKFENKKELDREEIYTIDDWVRNGNEMQENEKELLSKIIKEQATVTGKCNLMRKVTTPELQTTVHDIKTNPNDLVGRVITSKGFLSTSTMEKGATNFLGVKVKINNIYNTKGLDLSKIKGLSADLATWRSNEDEVVFNRGTQYKITKVNLYRDKSNEVYDYLIEADIIK